MNGCLLVMVYVRTRTVMLRSSRATPRHATPHHTTHATQQRLIGPLARAREIKQPAMRSRPGLPCGAARLALAVLTCGLKAGVADGADAFTCSTAGSGNVDYELRLTSATSAGSTCTLPLGGSWVFNRNTCCGTTTGSCPCVPSVKFAKDTLRLLNFRDGDVECTSSTGE